VLTTRLIHFPIVRICSIVYILNLNYILTFAERNIHAMIRQLIIYFSIALITASLPAREYAVVDIIGDSVTAGANLDFNEFYGWAHMLQGLGGGEFPPPPVNDIFTLWPDVKVNNMAFPGATAAEWSTSGGLRLQAVLDHHPDLVIIMIGGNDLLAAYEDGKMTELEMGLVQYYIERVIIQLKLNTPKPDIIVIGYYDFFDGMSVNLFPPYDKYAGLSDIVIEANSLTHDTAINRGAFYVSIYEDFLHHCYGRELGDTAPLDPPFLHMPLSQFDIHPVTAGHRAIFEKVYDKLKWLNSNVPSMGWRAY
jgi:lysophospholipase L1-like esterase